MHTSYSRGGPGKLLPGSQEHEGNSFTTEVLYSSCPGGMANKLALSPIAVLSLATMLPLSIMDIQPDRSSDRRPTIHYSDFVHPESLQIAFLFGCSGCTSREHPSPPSQTRWDLPQETAPLRSASRSHHMISFSAQLENLQIFS